MNIVKTGTTYRLFDGSVETPDRLPNIAFEVRFSPMAGFSLGETDMPDLRGETVYGDYGQKVDRVFRSYVGDKTKNLGVILSGDKGIGKTLFAKMTAMRGIAEGLPVIYVNHYFDGLPEFFRNITQDCIVVFDEFDKNFVSNDRNDNDNTACQDGLLTMFDGIYGGHKLFVITCNDVEKLSDCYVNRPGRFRYHLRFDYPDMEAVRQYMQDKVGDHKDIDRIIRFSSLVPLSYDCLSAIAAELKSGETFKGAMEMLNIVKIDDDTRYDIQFTYEANGTKVEETVDWDEHIGLFDDDGRETNVRDFSVRYFHCLSSGHQYNIGKVKFSALAFRTYGTIDRNGVMRLDPEHFEFQPYDGTSVRDEEKDEYKRLVKSVKPIELSIRPSRRRQQIGYGDIV